jgi:hypothetical protein
MSAPVYNNLENPATVYNRSSMVRLALSIVFLLVAGRGYSQDSVTFCDLVRNPDKYDGHEVSVRATYRYGFEWQELYCLDCKDKGKAWLEAPFDLDDAAIRPLRRCLLLIPRTTCRGRI